MGPVTLDCGSHVNHSFPTLNQLLLITFIANSQLNFLFQVLNNFLCGSAYCRSNSACRTAVNAVATTCGYDITQGE